MGNLLSIKAIDNIQLVNFDHIKSKDKDTIMINTLPQSQQECIISGTLSINKEIELINKLLRENKMQEIIIYGKNSSDKSVISKYLQLYNLGFRNIKLYNGGIFEWLLLQEIYGNEQFSTTEDILDILKYK